jgi:hypothetical protein
VLKTLGKYFEICAYSYPIEFVPGADFCKGNLTIKVKENQN